MTDILNEKVINLQEWDPTKARLMARWSFGYKLSNSTGQKLDICIPNEGPNWKLLLLPINKLPKGRWWIWTNSS